MPSSTSITLLVASVGHPSRTLSPPVEYVHTSAPVVASSRHSAGSQEKPPAAYTASASATARVTREGQPVRQCGENDQATRSGPAMQPPLADVRAESWP